MRPLNEEAAPCRRAACCYALRHAMTSDRSVPPKYTVVTSDDFGKFEDRVNELLEEGWQLQGGVTTAILSSAEDCVQHIQFSQALIFSGNQMSAHALKEEEMTLPSDSDAFSAGL